MADRDDDREIIRLRDRMHKAENRLTAQALDHETVMDHEKRIKALESFTNKVLGVMIVGGVMVPPVTALLVKVMG
jgi:hypothetical protein